jgi:hypothetical protein
MSTSAALVAVSTSTTLSEGTAALVDAKSTKGLVRSTVVTQDNPEVKVYARTRLDDIVIHRVAS